jgi:ABC-2 type transport system ATP-binding protein
MPNDPLAAAAIGSGKLPTGLALAVVPLLVLIVALDVYCLIDLARAKSVRHVPRWVWAIVILFVSAPIGALVYMFAGRDRGQDAAHDPAPARAVADASGGEPGTSGEAGVDVSAGAGAGVGADVGAAAGGGVGVDVGAGAGGQVGVDVGAGAGAEASQETGRAADRQPGDQAPAGCWPIVTTSGLTRDYGGAGLFDVDLVVPRGSIYGLVGPNGAGKTTLLSLLSATRRPDRGTISMHIGRDRIAVCPDVPEFDGWLTAAEVTDLARSLVAPSTGKEAVAAALAAAGLAGSAGRRVGGFSRGMLQRLGLACALVGEPELLILDEPTSALDPAGRAEMLSLVAAMRGSRTVIFSSHILADVQRIADQVGILREGRLLYQGATKDLIDTYLEPSWLVRIAGDPHPVAAALAAAPWTTRAEPAGADAIRVDATSLEAGERGIPAVIAGCGARQVSCEPVAADLESAFLALTGARS